MLGNPTELDTSSSPLRRNVFNARKLAAMPGGGSSSVTVVIHVPESLGRIGLELALRTFFETKRAGLVVETRWRTAA